MWADVNLGGPTIRVRQSKTAAGVREVDLTPALTEELGTLKAAPGSGGAKDPVFASVHPGRRDLSKSAKLERHRVRRRILDRSIRAANESLVEKGIEPIGKVTIHGLRRTYASLRIAGGDDPVYMTNQIGHTSASLTMSVYAKAVKRRNHLTGETRIAFDKALEWAEIGRKSNAGDLAPGERSNDPIGKSAWANGF